MPRGVYKRKKTTSSQCSAKIKYCPTQEKTATPPKEDIARMALLAIRGYVIAMRMASEMPGISDMLRIEAIVDRGLGDGEDD